LHLIGLYYANKGHVSLDGIVPPMTLCILLFHTLHTKEVFLSLKFDHFACKETPLFDLNEAGHNSVANKTVTLIGLYFNSTNVTTAALCGIML